MSDLSGADLSRAKLPNAVILNCNFSEAVLNNYTDVSNAIINNLDSLKYLYEKGCQNIPDGIKNKQEVREKLLERGFIGIRIDYYLSLSQLLEA